MLNLTRNKLFHSERQVYFVKFSYSEDHTELSPNLHSILASLAQCGLVALLH